MPRIYYEYVPIWPSYETCLEMMNAKIQEFRVAVISGKEERRLDLLKRNQGNSARPFSLCLFCSFDVLGTLCFDVHFLGTAFSSRCEPSVKRLWVYRFQCQGLGLVFC